MKIRCIYNLHWLSRFGIRAVTLYPFILFAEPEENVLESLFRHELEHIYQVHRLGWRKFYFSYLRFYFRNRLRGLNHHQAYFQIPFEVDARFSETKKLSRNEWEILRGSQKV